MDTLKEGRNWSAHFDGERWMGCLTISGPETYAIGFWWIDEHTWNTLNDDNASELIRKGKCVYIFEEIRSVGFVVRIYDADWEQLIQWHSVSNRLSDYGDYVEDYSRGIFKYVNTVHTLNPDSLKDVGMNVRFP